MGAAGVDGWGWASDLDDVSRQVAVVGVGDSEHTRASGRTAVDIAGEAVERAIRDAGLEPRDVDGIMYTPFTGEQFDEHAFRERFGLPDHPLWVSHEGGGMVWTATAPYHAALALREGRCRYVVSSFAVAWATQRSEMVGGPGQSHAQELGKQNLEVPFGWFPQPVYFATVARRHMIDFGTTPAQLGAVAVTLRQHARDTPGSVMHDRPLTLEQYLASPLIADPFRKEDCCLISDGGAAYVMTTPERSRDLAQPPVDVLGVGLGNSRAGQHWAQQGVLTSTPQVFAAPASYRMAGVTVADVDVVACYDPFTIHSVMYAEDMGFCAKGEGGAYAAEGRLAVGGPGTPYNTHGGLLSHSYTLGIAHMTEVVRQLRGQAANQVAGATVGVVGGYTGPQAASCVLARG